MFTTHLLGHYQPVNWISFGLDYELWEMDPRGYHVTNLVLFVLSALVFYRVALRLLGGVAARRGLHGRGALPAAAGLAALLYAVHPLRVETVVWITARAYVLSGLFFLLSVLFYLRYADRLRGGQRPTVSFVLAVVCFGLSLFSRANAVALPLVLLLLDVYPLNRLDPAPRRWFGPERYRLWLEKVPFLLLAILAGGLAQWAKTAIGTVATVQAFPIAARLAMGAYALCFYVLKTVWPVGLLPLYEKPPRIDPFQAVYLLSGALVLTATLVFYSLRRRWPAGLLLWVYFLVMVAPVSGLVQIGAQLAADRYTQLACLGWALLAGAGYLWCWPDGARSKGGWALPAGVTVLCAVVIACLVGATRKQSRVWLDSETLWRATLAGEPNNLTALNNLAGILAQSERREEAMKLTRRALDLQPEFPDVLLNLGSMMLEEGRYDEAINHFTIAIEKGLEDAKAYSNLGAAWAEKGDLARAESCLAKALSIDPDEAEAHYNLGIIYFRQGREAEAEEQFVTALRLRPDYPDAAYNLRVVREQRQGSHRPVATRPAGNP
jgi:tetratricopeptide (TPR) repeat protein